MLPHPVPVCVQLLTMHAYIQTDYNSLPRLIQSAFILKRKFCLSSYEILLCGFHNFDCSLFDHRCFSIFHRCSNKACTTLTQLHPGVTPVGCGPPCPYTVRESGGNIWMVLHQVHQTCIDGQFAHHWRWDGLEWVGNCTHVHHATWHLLLITIATS